MPEIISLLSSPQSSPPRQKPTALRRSPSPALARSIANFGSDDFDFLGLSGELDSPILPSSKKRKLSPRNGGTAFTRRPGIDIYTISDDEDLPLPRMTVTKSGKNAEHPDHSLMPDPIGFSSSAPEARTANIGEATGSDLSDDLPSDIMALGDSFSLSQPTTVGNGRMPLSERTVNLLAGLNKKPGLTASKVRSSTATAKRRDVGTSVEDILSSSPRTKTLSSSTKASKPRDGAKDAKEKERAIAKAAKEKEREEEKERKRLAKEQKAKEKQAAADIAEVNKSKTDKRVSVTEMIVEMSWSLRGQSVGDQVMEYMKHLEVETAFFEDAIDLSQDLEDRKTYGNLVKWRRKVKARYNEDLGHWEPIMDQIIEDEDHILVYLTASDFAGIATLGNKVTRQESTATEEAMLRNIDQHVSELRRKHKDRKPIYLIEGLEALLRKNKAAKNRAYTAAVLSQHALSDPSGPPASSQARRRKKADAPSAAPDYSFIDSDLAETLLLHLQLNHSVLIHQTTTPSDTAFWIRNFTEHISTIPYRHERMSLNDAGAAFCMDVGQVKAGDDAHDTYVKMLQEVQRVTPPIAYGIANLYPNVKALVKAFREEGQLVLEDVKKGANKDGAVTNSRLGPAMSKRLYKVFMGTNEWSTDGIS